MEEMHLYASENTLIFVSKIKFT